MEKRTKKMLLTILMIISVLTTDFYVLGSGIITYAAQLNTETNNTNIEFTAFFKKGENRVDSIEESIKSDDVRLYAEIKVKNEGYLTEGTVIEIENSNFNLKSEILSSNTHINAIEGNKVYLKQINNDETIEIELGIEPIKSDNLNADFLTKISTVKIIGTYVYSKSEDGESIRAERAVSVNYQPDETTTAQLVANMSTNRVIEVNGINKRVVQLSINSKLTDNDYPIQQTTLLVDIPEVDGHKPEVNAMAFSELATNGLTEISEEDYSEVDGKLQITIKNEPDSNNQISWKKDIWDRVIVTYIYPETVDISGTKIAAKSEIKLYNSENTYTRTATAEIEDVESNNTIMGRVEITTKEIYKGQLYANLETQYNSKSRIIITNANVADEILMQEGPDIFGTTTSEIPANTRYIASEINLAKMLDILGQDGYIEIKNGETTAVVNKGTVTDENGNVVINYENGTSQIEIKTSKPAKTGVLEINHTRVLANNGYTTEQLKTIELLRTTNKILTYLNGNGVWTTTTIATGVELKETISKAELTIGNNKTALSTTEPNELTLGITLITNGVHYDLYKNPKISLKFPAAVENVQLITSPSKQNANEFTVNVGEFNATNKTLQINLQGEQLAYPESELTQAHIQLNLKVTLSTLALAQTDKIIMAYTNENASQYEGGTTYGIVEQEIEISAPSQLVTMFNLSSNENKSLTETVVHQIKNNEVGKTHDLEIKIINNEDSDISDVKILGELPTTGNTIAGQDENTLETILKAITAPNATVYYTENTSATIDIENTTNGWTQELSLLTNAKLYLIKLDSLERGTSYTATLSVQIPSSIKENTLSYTQYGVMYDTATENEVKESSRKIGLATSMAATIKTEITAQVGQDVIKSGDTVKEGEVIRYTVTLNNKGTETLENVELKLDIPEGTTYVQPFENYVYADGYYEEITDSDKLADLTTITIPQLTPTAPYTKQYEVRVNKGAAGTELLNTPTAIYNGTEIENAEFKNTVQASNIRVSIKRQDDERIMMYAGGSANFGVYIENLSDKPINNLEMNIMSSPLKIMMLTQNNGTYMTGENLPNKITVSEIPANSKIILSIYGIIAEKADIMNTLVTVNDSTGNTYRSNVVSQEIIYTNATINMTSPQNGKELKEGDLVEYNIGIKNTGNNKGEFNIISQIAESLQIQYIYINEKIIKQNVDSSDKTTYMYLINNYINEYIKLNSGEEANMKIVAKVRYVADIYNGKAVTSNAYVMNMEILEDSAEVVTHILKSSDESIENVISGFAWFDENENGQKDAKEETLSGITVKLYDITTNKYVKDENGVQLKTLTNSYGEYSLSKISDGSYLVVFEYDTEKYVLTTSFAENVDSSLNSKVSIKEITGDGLKIRVGAIELNNLNQNVCGMNVGLKENKGETPENEQPGIEIIPTEPEQPEQPDKPTDPENPDNPDNPEKPDEPVDLKTISGLVWLDSNINGQKDKEESYLSRIKVRLYSVSAKDYLKDADGKIIQTTTNENGEYQFTNLEKGEYIVIFEYNTEEYKLTIQNKNVAVKKINIDGKEIKVAVTDKLNVQKDISNINIGLQENLKFDLELSKYISKIVVQTSKNTKTYDYDHKTLGKVEIHRKQVQGALVVLEYTIKIKNSGEMAGYAKNIVDYLPSGLTFSSELNADWYISGNNLHTKSLENVQLNPGEEREVKLILTKAMTTNNVGLINNRAEIYEDYNKYGESDIDSTPNNQNQNEDDFGTTDVIIQVATGGSNIAYIILVFINLVLIYVAIKIMIKNEIIEIKPRKKGGRA